MSSDDFAAPIDPTSSGPRQPAAVLWDMDGTLVDTEPYWFRAETELAAEHGATWSSAQGQALVGYELPQAARLMQEQMPVALSPEMIVDALLHKVVAQVEAHIPWQPGARELLAQLRADGVATGLVTMSYRRFVEPIMAALPSGSFDVVVTGDEVGQGKPHPEPYLTAAAALGVEPEECVAIEDSPTGSASADAAGCTVLVVPSEVPVPEGPRRVFKETLRGVSVADLRLLPDRDL